MNCGFWTMRWRYDRRSGLPREAFVPFWLGRIKTLTMRVAGLVKLFFQLEEVWLRSRPKSKVEEALEELIVKTRQDIHDWRELKARELIALYAMLHDQMPEVKIPSVVAVWIKKHNPFAGAYTRAYARRIWRRWYLHVWNPLTWVDVWMFEWVNGVRFLRHLLIEGRIIRKARGHGERKPQRHGGHRGPQRKAEIFRERAKTKTENNIIFTHWNSLFAFSIPKDLSL